MERAPKLHRISPGLELVELLLGLARPDEAWIDAAGHVQSVELRLAGDAVDAVHALAGRYTLAHLAGPSGGPFFVTLARATGAGIEMAAGQLVRALSDGVTASVRAAGGLAADAPERSPASSGERPGSRSSDEGGRLPGPDESAKQGRQEPAPSASSPPAWTRSSLASSRAREDEQDDEPVVSGPEAGDRVLHFAFGLCDVLSSDGDRLRIRDVGGAGRIREVSLGMLRLTSPIDSDGHKLFRLERRQGGG